ncbi:hypothetical protein RU639_011972 [Aspergillus parasiticus]
MGIIRGPSLVSDEIVPVEIRAIGIIQSQPTVAASYYSVVTYSVPTKQPRPRSSWFNGICLDATCPRLPLKQDAGKLNSGRAKKFSWC